MRPILILAATVFFLLLAANTNAGRHSYTCEVLSVYDLADSGILELSDYAEKMKGGAFTVSRITGHIMGEVLSTKLSKLTQVINRGSSENAFKATANFGHQVQLLEIQEFHQGPIKPFVAMSMGGAGVVTGICK